MRTYRLQTSGKRSTTPAVRGQAGDSPTVDSFEYDLRLHSVTVGAILTVTSALVIAAYCGFTWNQPHRPLMLAFIGPAVVIAGVVPFLPMERVIRSRWREPFFLTWSMAVIVVVSAAVILDGTDESPLALTYVLPLIFAASSYPLASTIVVCLAAVTACLTVGLSDGGGVGRVMVLTGLLGCAAFMSALQARNHDRQRAALGRISRTDPLTGLLNRRGFEERMTAALRSAERTGDPVALLLLDLDGFKGVNDQHGHAAGDELLRWTAQQVGECVRPADAVGRIGGDEFAIVAPKVGAGAADDLAARIVAVLGARIGASVGTAIYPGAGSTEDALHRHADEGLYRAKRARHEALDTVSPATAPPLSLTARAYL
jgi:diguanylate cyclase (GGDEF)-like protein